MENNMIQNAAKTQVTEGGVKKSLKSLITAMEPQIAKALPSVITPERFTRMVLTAISSTPKLGVCTPESFLGAMMQAAQLGLEPNTDLGQAYIIPYSDHGTLKAQFQLGYKGLIDLAYRSGEIEIIQAHIVYENDDFEFEYGLNPKLAHKPANGDRGKPIYVYGMFKTKAGGCGFEVASMADIENHAKKYSKSYSSASSPWKTSFNEMAKKTVLKSVLKYAPLKSDFVRELSTDNTIKSNIAPEMYAEPDETDYSDVITVDAETGEVQDE